MVTRFILLELTGSCNPSSTKPKAALISGGVGGVEGFSNTPFNVEIIFSRFGTSVELCFAAWT
jgi:hypothetical protein